MNNNDTTQTLPTLKCSCPCGCTQNTKFPYTESKILQSKARCEKCGATEHKTKYTLPSTNKEELSRPITKMIQLDPEELKLDQEIAAQQKAEIRNAALQKWHQSVPEKFRYATTEHPKVLERLRRWQAGNRGTAGLVVLGGVGEGKTFLSVGYANAAIDANLIDPSQVLFGTEAELLSSAANSTFSEVDQALKKLISSKYKMIIIDDVGRGTWIRDDMRPKVFSLVFDAFWRDNRVIVVTTNLIPPDLQEYVGEGAMDRLRSMVGYDALDLSNRDMRKKVTQETIQKFTPTSTSNKNSSPKNR
jgi:DNA replication protein DnaC